MSVNSLDGTRPAEDIYLAKAGGGRVVVFRSEDYDPLTSGSSQHLSFGPDRISGSSSIVLHNRTAYGGANIYFLIDGDETVVLTPGESLTIPHGWASGCVVLPDNDNPSWQVIITK